MNIFRWFLSLFRPKLSLADEATAMQQELMPTPQENELQRLRARVGELQEQLEKLRASSRQTDLVAIRGGENMKAQEMKFRLLKQNYRDFKRLAAHIVEYVKIEHKGRPSKALQQMVDACELYNACDPDLFGMSNEQKRQAIEQQSASLNLLGLQHTLAPFSFNEPKLLECNRKTATRGRHDRSRRPPRDPGRA